MLDIANKLKFSTRKKLIENYNLYTVLDLPGGVFTVSGVKSIILFFLKKAAPIRKICYYQLNLDRSFAEIDSLSEDDLADFVKIQETKTDSDNSCTVKTADVNQET
jgi:type I restriction enzyme M protein